MERLEIRHRGGRGRRGLCQGDAATEDQGQGEQEKSFPHDASLVYGPAGKNRLYL